MRAPSSVITALCALHPSIDEPQRQALATKLEPLITRYERIDAVSLAEALARRVKHPGELEALRVDDVLWAEACLDGDPEALRELEVCLATASRGVARRASVSERDELQQRLRIRLLVAEDGAGPKLAQYAGRGALAGYVKVVAMNLLLRVQAPRPPSSDSGLTALPDALDWESGVLRVDQQVKFREAFRKAVSLLTVRQRALLRLNLLDGLTIDELAPLYGAHRSSVARWLAEAKGALESETRRQTAELLRLEPAEVERLLSRAQQGFELSLTRALRESLVSPG